jgi:hypothetical protein
MKDVPDNGQDPHHDRYNESVHVLHSPLRTRERNSVEAIQISRIVWNVHCRVHNSPPLLPAMNQTKPTQVLRPVHAPPHTFKDLVVPMSWSVTK